MNQFLVEQGDLRMLDTHGKRFGGALADRYLLMPGSLSGLISPSLRDPFQLTPGSATSVPQAQTRLDPEIDFARHIIFAFAGNLNGSCRFTLYAYRFRLSAAVQRTKATAAPCTSCCCQRL